MTQPICLFPGTMAPFNVRNHVSNVGWMLSDEFRLHLVSTDSQSLTDEVREDFEVFGEAYPNTDPGAFAALHDYLDEHDPAAVTALIKIPTYGTAASILARYHDVPYVHRYPANRFAVYEAASGWRKPGYFGLCNVFSRVPLELASRHVALGPEGKRHLTDRGADPDRVSILPPSIDATRFEGEIDPADVGVPPDRSVVLFVGRDTRMKGFDALGEAIPRVLATRDDLHFVFVGVDRVPRVPNRYGDHLTAVGRVDPAEMPRYFARADVFLHPSLSEGLPRVLGEALFSHTPVLARDVGEIGSVTDNTFTTNDEMVSMLLDFEDLPLDDPTPLSRSSLRPDYVDFYTKFY